VLREMLQGGAVRLGGRGCGFLVSRLAPRQLLLTAYGRDDGRLGSAPLDEMAAELDRFGPPLRVFADARGAQGVAAVVQDRWREWFAARRKELAGVDVLVPDAVVQLAISTVRHFAGGGEWMRVLSDAAAFEAAVRAVAAGFVFPSPSRFEEEPLAVVRRAEGDGTIRLEGGRCRFEYRRERPGLVLVRISGHDDGALGAAPLDELRDDLRGRDRRRPRLFVDARDTRGVAAQARDLWSAWFEAHRAELEAVHVLAASPLVSLNVGLGRQLSRTGSLMRLHSSPEDFEAALADARGLR
jgi:hypothetical protein